MQTNYSGPALLHVGYIKTATTYLQKNVFRDPSFGMSLAGGEDNRSHLMKWFRTGDQYLFNPNRISEEMAQLEAPVRSEGLIPVWSEEVLLGNPITRHYDGAWTLARLRSLNKKFKILITIRKQTDLCLSAYREYLKLHRHSIRDFIGTGNEPRSFKPILQEEYLAYDVAVGEFINAFGAENVLILPQELLRIRPAEYINRLMCFVDATTAASAPMQQDNVGLGGAALLSSRLLNAFFVRSPLHGAPGYCERISRKLQRAVDRLAPKNLDLMIERRWKEEIQNRYGNSFNESNSRLQLLTEIDLTLLGYSLSRRS